MGQEMVPHLRGVGGQRSQRHDHLSRGNHLATAGQVRAGRVRNAAALP